MLKEKLDSAFAFLQTKSPPLIGVDISSSAIKLVELSEVGKGAYRLERYVIEPLPRDVVSDGNIANLDQVTEALRRGYNHDVAPLLALARVEAGGAADPIALYRQSGWRERKAQERMPASSAAGIV